MAVVIAERIHVPDKSCYVNTIDAPRTPPHELDDEEAASEF